MKERVRQTGIVLLAAALVLAIIYMRPLRTVDKAEGSDVTILAGVHEQYQGPTKTTPEQTLQRYPKAAVTREFAANVLKPSNLIPKLKSLCEKVWAEDLVCAISFKFSVNEVYNRQWMPYLQQAADWLKTSGHTDKTIFIIWHEPENDFAGGGKRTGYFKDARDFVGYFNMVHDALKSVNPGLLTCYAGLGYAFRDKGEVSAEQAKQLAKVKADIKALDIYSGRSFPLGTTLPELSGFRNWLTNVVGPEGTYAITERGWMADTPTEFELRANTIKREADWLRNDPDGKRCVIYIPWLTEGTENDPTLKPDAKMTDAVNYLLETVTAPEEVETDPVAEPPMTDCPLCLGAGKVKAGATYVVTRQAGV